MKFKSSLKPVALGALLCLGITASMTANANTIQIGRYLSVPMKAQNDQLQLLQQQVQVVFPQNVLSIQDAAKFLLAFSGYQLADHMRMPKATRTMLKQPLPEVDRHFGPMTLAQGLQTLSGKAFYLLIDPVHKQVSFKLRTDYQSLFNPSTPHLYRLRTTEEAR